MPEIRLLVGSMRCRRCVRAVTSWLRDVPGVETVTADGTTGIIVLGGSMVVDDVLRAFAGSSCSPELLDGPSATG